MTSVWIVIRHERDEKSEVLGLFSGCPADEVVLCLAGDGPWVKEWVGWRKEHVVIERIERQVRDAWGRVRDPTK